MLEKVLRHMNNRFEYETVSGTFEVSGGTLDVPGALGGQYYWIEGSRLNDGLHLHPANDMADEVFEGRVVLLAIPKAVVDLADEIAAWVDSHADVLDNPYDSESFGGYSYSKASGGSGAAEAPSGGWKSHFRYEMYPYRKLSRDWS